MFWFASNVVGDGEGSVEGMGIGEGYVVGMGRVLWKGWGGLCCRNGELGGQLGLYCKDGEGCVVGMGRVKL